MPPQKIDVAILRALKLSAENASVSSHGGSGFSSTLKITSGDKKFFVKQGKGKEAEVMFLGEYTSLNTIHSAHPTLCPRALAHGPLQDSPSTYYLATEFIDLSSSSSSSTGPSLAAKLAKLHTTPSPTPHRYGFDVTTCCGSTPQDNTYEPTWARFFAYRRLKVITRGMEGEMQTWVDRMCGEKKNGDGEVGGVVGRLLNRMGGDNLQPVCCHGDLWSGNQSIGKIIGRSADNNENEMKNAEAVIFDPSAVYAPAEYDHGIMKMFGGFNSSFWNEYNKLVPKAEPVKEYEDRVQLYTLYHTLNHYAIFGGGYGGSAIGIMKRLWEKYKDDL